MKATVWQYFIVGGTLNLASTAAAQVPVEGSAETPAHPEKPAAIPDAASAKAPAPDDSSFEDSLRSESSAELPAPIERGASSRARSERVDPGNEVLDDLSLVELMDVQVTGAGFFALPAEKAPNVSYRLEAKNFSRLPVRNLAQLLDMTVPGLVVGNNRFYGPIIAQRGSLTDSNSKTVVMLDGQNLNQRFDYGYNMALALPLLGDLRAVEVVQGPGPSLYGSGSITGSVDMLPKTGKSNPGLELATELGPFDDANTVEAGYGMSYGPASANNELYVYGGVARAGGATPNTHS